jgi:large subunit ribosomal protein L28
VLSFHGCPKGFIIPFSEKHMGRHSLGRPMKVGSRRNIMAKTCSITGKNSIVINTVSRRGKAKADGGVGKKTTGISKVRKYANLQKKTVLVNGERKSVWLSARAMRKLPDGMVIVAK